MLDDLRCESGIGLCFVSESIILITDFYHLITRCLSRSAEQGQAAFFRFKRNGLTDDLRIVHNGVPAVIVERNDAHRLADHVCSHTDTGLLMRLERVEQISSDSAIFFCCRF